MEKNNIRSLRIITLCFVYKTKSFVTILELYISHVFLIFIFCSYQWIFNG